MNTQQHSSSRSSSLIDRSDSVLVVIDVQDAFVHKLSSEQRQPLLDRISWLMRIANKLLVPLVVTAEDMDVLGDVCPKIRRAFPDDTQEVHNKMVFGLADQPDILAAVERLERGTIVLVGLETDVCVAHSALGLLDRGYKVAVVQDATGSPGAAHSYGLQRMEQSGVIMTNVKGIYFEWVRTVKGDNSMKDYMKGVGDSTPPVDL